MGPGTGSKVLEQRVTRFAPGRSLPRGNPERDELLYAVSGSGALELDGEPHDLQSESGAYVRAGETYVIDNPGPDELLIVSTSVPVAQVYRSPREVIVRFADRPELRADAKRTFRYLVNQDAGCMDATQFVGIVEPCRAPDHSHSYDEVGYIVEGEGFAHIEGESIPLQLWILFSPATRAGSLHREHRTGRDADPRCLPSFGGPGVTGLRGRLAVDSGVVGAAAFGALIIASLAVAAPAPSALVRQPANRLHGPDHR